MKTTSPWITASSVVAAALLCLLPHTTGFAQSYSIRPTCNPSGQCKTTPGTWGFNDTSWRKWPVQPRPEQDDAKTIGGTVIPTPPPILEPPLPHAETLPPKPAVSGGTTGSILPSGSGSMVLPDSSKIDGGMINGPLNLNPGTPADKRERPGTPLDLGPRRSDGVPKPEGSGGESLLPPTESLQPRGPAPEKLSPTPAASAPEKLTPTPAAPMPESPKIPDKDAPAPNLPMLSPDPVPSPPAKAGEPSPAKPLKDSSLSPRRHDVVVARATAIQSDPPMQANWNAALEPEAVGENRLRSASYQQRAVETVNPLRCALDGYCPVELQDNDRWVAGNPEFQLSYQGQVYHFYNEAARNQFEAAPQKYAPVRGGSDVVLLLEENRNVPGSVNHSAVWHGRLYLFSTAATLATFQQDPSRYADSPRQATLQLPASSL